MANDLAPMPKKELIPIIEARLTEMIKEKIKAFPKDFNETRFIQNCMAVLQDTKDIEKCSPQSIVRTLAKGAYLGLDFFRKECYPIPYGGELTFQTDYKGEVKLAKRYGRGVVDVYAKLVQEGDDLVCGIVDGVQKLNFTPKPFNEGEIIGVFAVVLYKDGTIKYDTMSKKDVEDTRKNYSKAPNSPAWQKSWGEQAKKTVIRRLCKLVDLDFDTIEQQRAYNEGGDAEIRPAGQGVAPKIKDPFAANKTAEAEIVSPGQADKGEDQDAKLRAEIRAKYPDEEDWQIDARVSEAKGEVE